MGLIIILILGIGVLITFNLSQHKEDIWDEIRKRMR